MSIPPVIRFSEFAVSGVSPSGSRHVTTHPSYVKELGTGAGQYLDFGSINISNGKQSTPTKAVVAMVDDMKDATEAVYNLRIWASDLSSFKSGTYYINTCVSGLWLRNCTLTDASGYSLPTFLPSGQNIWRQDGGAEITASGLDSQVTQYAFSSVTIDQDVPIGIYGGDSGGFRTRLTFDYR